MSVAKELKIPPTVAVASRSANERIQFDPTTMSVYIGGGQR